MGLDVSRISRRDLHTVGLSCKFTWMEEERRVRSIAITPATAAYYCSIVIHPSSHFSFFDCAAQELRFTNIGSWCSFRKETMALSAEARPCFERPSLFRGASLRCGIVVLRSLFMGGDTCFKRTFNSSRGASVYGGDASLDLRSLSMCWWSFWKDNTVCSTELCSSRIYAW